LYSLAWKNQQRKAINLRSCKAIFNAKVAKEGTGLSADRQAWRVCELLPKQGNIPAKTISLSGVVTFPWSLEKPDCRDIRWQAMREQEGRSPGVRLVVASKI